MLERFNFCFDPPRPRYTIEWIGREGLDAETHEEYLAHFIGHFYKNIIKLVDRAMRKEDSSAQGVIITEILQHLHACMNSVKVFYGRDDSLERIKNYMLGDSTKPMILYGEGGCGKTSLLAKTASIAQTQWFNDVKPISIIRFLGTTPDSSTLTPALISICQQVGAKSHSSALLPHFHWLWPIFLDLLQLYDSIRHNSRRPGPTNGSL